MELLTQWDAEQWSALGAMLTAAVAVVAAVVAYFQVREARRLREEQAKPFVIVDIQPSTASRHILNLVIENTGATLAKNVKIVFDPPVESSIPEHGLQDSVLLQRGLPMVPPRRRLEFMFDSSVERHGRGLPLRYDVTVTYDDQRGRPQESLLFPIDLAPLYGLAYVEEKGLHHIAKALEELQKTTSKWTASRGRLGVSVHHEDAERHSALVEEAVTGRRPSLASAPPSEYLMWVGRWAPARWLIRAWRVRGASRL